MSTRPDDFYFEGFTSPTYTPVPDAVFDQLLSVLGHAELKALLYIIRRTFGFKKDADAISFTQFLHGITTVDGTVLDRGCGIKNATNLNNALKSLEDKGIIIATKVDDPSGDKAATIYSLHFAEGVLLKKQYPTTEPAVGVLLKKQLQETVIQETVIQEEYPSKIRKAKSGKRDYVNPRPEDREEAPTQSTPEETEQRKRERPPHTQRVGNEERQQLSKNRKFEEPQQEKYTPDREEIHKPPARRRSAPGVASVGELLQQQSLPQAVPDDEAYEAIRDFVRDMAGKNHDEASLKSSTTRAYNLYQRAGVSLSYFFNLVYEADKEASRRSTTITKRTAEGFTNRMAYFFAVLEDKLGLREKLPPASP